MKKFSFIPLFLCASTLALASCNLLGGSSSGKKSSKKKSSSTETSQVSGSSQAGGSSATSSSQQGGSSATSSSSGGSSTVTSISFSSVVSWYASEGITVTIPDYQGSTLSAEIQETTYFIDGSNADEFEAFATSMKSAGWGLVADSYGDYSGAFGSTRAEAYVGNYIGVTNYDCIIVQFKLGVEPTATFPGAEVNEFLNTYSMGFTLSESVISQLTDPSGDGYSTTTGVDTSGTYHYISIEVNGDASTTWKNALDPVVTAVGYSWNDEYECYVNSAEHEVQLGYESGVTRLVFFE